MSDDGHEVREAFEDLLDDPDEPIHPVGVVAELLGVDAQVVRGYDQRGLVTPGRSSSGHRRYSRRDIRRLTRAMRLAEEGIPASGIERILALEDELGRIERDATADRS
ncbi:MAG: MerR family transcriptional regulator [Nitriliruptoraceae bacterium]